MVRNCFYFIELCKFWILKFKVTVQWGHCHHFLTFDSFSVSPFHLLWVPHLDKLIRKSGCSFLGHRQEIQFTYILPTESTFHPVLLSNHNKSSHFGLTREAISVLSRGLNRINNKAFHTSLVCLHGIFGLHIQITLWAGIHFPVLENATHKLQLSFWYIKMVIW